MSHILDKTDVNECVILMFYLKFSKVLYFQGALFPNLPFTPGTFSVNLSILKVL